MKLHFALLVLCGATLAAIVAATVMNHRSQNAAPAASAQQVFEARGQIRSLEADGTTVHIAHEEIPGFMPAMEMPFTVKDPALLRGFASGDSVKFQLIVTKDDSWITEVEKTAASSNTPPSAPEQVAASTDEARRVENGQQVPDFTLIDQNGHPFRLQDFRGKAVVLTFIYTRCPLPNFCPLMSKNFASLQERLGKSSQVQLLSISFDPQFDTPEVLRRYAALFQHDEKNWTFATGTPEQVDFVTGLFGLIREPSNGFINHDLRTALISPEGKLVHVWRSNVWTPSEVERMVRDTLNGRTQLSSAWPARKN